MKKLFLFLAAIFCIALSASAQRTASGVVVDAETDEPLVGATVMPIGGGTPVITDIDGNYSLTVPNNVKEIKVSYVGYDTKSVPVATDLKVAMQTNNRLETVVVTGYGSAKKLGSVVGAVSVVGEEQFQNVPTATFVDALQGQVSGLSIFSSSGDPSSGENQIRLRGVNSIFAGTTPLFILDGAPITETVFTTLNPGDIESITVLKDAASVAIYGSRAANGVIVITSKKGKFGERAKVTLRANLGWSSMVDDKVNMMNAKQNLEYRKMIATASGSDWMSTDAYKEIDRAVNVYGIDTNWRDETFTAHAPTYSLEATVQGGSDSFAYYVSLNHYDAAGIIDQSDMRREAFRINLGGRITPWLRINSQTNLGFTKFQTNNESNTVYSGGGIYGSNPMFFARKALPYDSPRYYVVNEQNQDQIDYLGRAYYLHFSGMPTPWNTFRNRSVWRNRVTVNQTLAEQINPIDGLMIRATQNVDAYDTRLKNYGFVKTELVTPMGDTYDYDGDLDGYHQESFSRYYSFTYNNVVEYSKTIADKHSFTVLAGQESIISKSEGFGIFVDGYTDNRLLMLNQSASAVTPNSDITQSISETVFNSFFFSANYDYDSKYFIEGSFRRDGSSKFAPSHRWANFWAVGGAWNIKNETFMAPVTWVDDLKLHISYGTTGNSSISNYSYFGTIGAGGAYNGQNSTGLGNPSNYDLTWETVKAFDLGLNFGFLNIFSGEVDFYNKKTVDMLMPIPYSFTTGYSEGFGNIGDMQNRGVDFNLQADIIKTRDWYWAVRGNFNYNRNKITRLFNDQDQYTLPNTGTTFKVGHSAGELYSVRYAGVDPRDGMQMWYDKDGNLTKNYNEERDAVLTGKDMYSPYSGGFGTDLRWKTLALKVDFTWAAKKYMTSNDAYFYTNNVQGSTGFNQCTEMLNMWMQPGDKTDIPKYDQAPEFDTRFIEDASFVRLKNVTLQYALPQNVLNKLRLNALSFHFTGRNLLTFTDFSGYDPEPESNLVKFYYPNTRQYEFGVEVTF